MVGTTVEVPKMTIRMACAVWVVTTASAIFSRRFAMILWDILFFISLRISQLKINWNVFPIVQLIISNHWFIDLFGHKRQAIIWTRDIFFSIHGWRFMLTICHLDAVICFFLCPMLPYVTLRCPVTITPVVPLPSMTFHGTWFTARLFRPFLPTRYPLSELCGENTFLMIFT